MVSEGKAVRLPRRSDLGVMANLFEAIQRGDYNHSSLQPDVDVLRRLLLFCRDETDLLTDQDASLYADALLAIAAHHRDWVRPVEHWRASSHNASRQFRSLLRHLLARYDVPDFLDAAWFKGLTGEGVKQQRWYKHIALGRNIRTVDDLPIPLTKKQAHHFLQAPNDFDIPSAFRWAVIIDLGGDERLVRSILRTRIGTTFGAEEFWITVFRFLIAHPTLDPSHHGPIVDFLLHRSSCRRFPTQRTRDQTGPPLIPPQANLCMKGRTPESLLRAVGEWHRSLSSGRTVPVTTLGPSGFPAFIHEEGLGEDARRYEIVELLTSHELILEGSLMHHCVASYARSCASGRTSIWSLRKRIESGRVVRLATIEVSNKERRIVQVRRRWNKLPTSGDLSLLVRWSEAGGPKLSYWLAT